LVVIYFQGFKQNIKLRNFYQRGAETQLPIKLFYLSNTPIILQAALVSNLHFFSQVMYRKFKGNAFVRLLGTWQEHDARTGGPKLIGGLAYYLVPPNSLSDIYNNPTHFFIYMFFITASCAAFSKLWLEISGRSPEDLVKQLKEGKMYLADRKEDAMIGVLKKKIPVAAIVGGIMIGLLSISSDLLGAIGGGTGILLVVNIIYGYVEVYQNEYKGQKNKNNRAIDW